MLFIRIFEVFVNFFGDSPEIYKDKPYDKKSDMWSLGCILYEMCCLRPPFVANSFKDLRRNVLLGASPPIPKFYSEDMSSVVKKLLKLNPNDRPTTSELLKMRPIIRRSKVVFRNLENLKKSADKENESKQKLMKTIKMKDFKSLKYTLPKPNYNSSGMIARKNESREDSRSLSDSIQHKPRNITVGEICFPGESYNQSKQARANQKRKKQIGSGMGGRSSTGKKAIEFMKKSERNQSDRSKQNGMNPHNPYLDKIPILKSKAAKKREEVASRSRPKGSRAMQRMARKGSVPGKRDQIRRSRFKLNQVGAHSMDQQYRNGQGAATKKHSNRFIKIPTLHNYSGHQDGSFVTINQKMASRRRRFLDDKRVRFGAKFSGNIMLEKKKRGYIIKKRDLSHFESLEDMIGKKNEGTDFPRKMIRKDYLKSRNSKVKSSVGVRLGEGGKGRLMSRAESRNSRSRNLRSRTEDSPLRNRLGSKKKI